MALQETYSGGGGGGALGPTIREDLLDFITNIDPTDTPLLSMLAMSTAASTNHIWMQDTLVSPVALIKANEGADFSSDTLTTPTRYTNYTQIIRRDFNVSGTADAVNHAGMANQSSYQAMKAMKDVANATELALIQGEGDVGASGTAREMDGLHVWSDSSGALAGSTNDGNGAANVTGVGADGPSETELVTGLQNIWTEGATADTVLANAAMKKGISSFTTTARIHHQGGPTDERKITRNIQTFESDFGTVDVFLERYVDSLDTGYAFSRQYFRTAWLRPTRMERLAKVGDSERYMVLHECTLEALAPNAATRFVIL